MGAVALALLTAVSYGVSDFLGGILSKRHSAWMVAAFGFVGSIPIALLAAFLVSGHPSGADFAWAAGGGVGEGLGIGALYLGLSRGRMTVVAPISGVGPVLIPAVVGLATGQVPSAVAWVGIVLAFPAIYLIPQGPEGELGDPGAAGEGAAAVSADGADAAREGGASGMRSDLLTGLAAAVGFGAQFALIGQIGHDAGLFPIVVLMLAAAATVIVVATVLREPWLPRRGDSLAPLVPGILSAIAVISFTLATRLGLLPVVSVVGALYPAATVILAAILLGERLGRVQVFGLGLAVGAVVLVTLG